MPLTPFHVAVQVRDIAEARRFYTQVIGCAEGDGAPDRADFDMYGHQFICHLNPQLGPEGRLTPHFKAVDTQAVPVPHCGVVLKRKDWDDLVERLRQYPVEWVIEPQVRYHGSASEQATLFILDPSGNALEFKSFPKFAERLFSARAAGGLPA